MNSMYPPGYSLEMRVPREVTADQNTLSLSAEEIEAMSAEELIKWASDEFGTGLAMSCSWQKQSSVLTHMVYSLGLSIPVIELDTHLLFRETYEIRDRLVSEYGLQLIQPEILTIADQHRDEGPNLWESDPDRCCHLRKVEPLIRVLKPFTAWMSGVRRSQSPSRANLPKAVYSETYGVWKLHPFAEWDEQAVWDYIEDNQVPYHPLHDVGYRSIGCIPCTRPTAPDEEERAGRWAGSDKLECGIHELAASDQATPLPYPVAKLR